METTAVPQKFEKVLEILEKNGNNPARLIPILQQIQDEYRYLPEEIMTFAATSLGISPAKVFGVAMGSVHGSWHHLEARFLPPIRHFGK